MAGRGRRLLATMAAAAALSGGTVLVAGEVAAAHEPGTNGCSFSPDVGYVPVYYDFHRACDQHDLCYLNKPFGNSSAGRKACDDQFRSAMRGWCDAYYSRWYQAPAKLACRGVAETYYTAVRTFGGAFF